MNLEEDFKERIDKHLNSEYEGGYRCSVDIDTANNEAYFCIMADESKDVPLIGKFVDEVIEELEMDQPYVKNRLERAEGKYETTVTDLERIDETGEFTSATP